MAGATRTLADLRAQFESATAFCGSAPRGAALASALGALLRQVGCGRETRSSRHQRMLGLRQVRGGCAVGGPGGGGLHYVWK